MLVISKTYTDPSRFQEAIDAAIAEAGPKLKVSFVITPPCKKDPETGIITHTAEVHFDEVSAA